MNCVPAEHLAAHEVEVVSEPLRDEAAIAARLAGFEALVVIRERTRVTKSLLEKLPALRLVVQTAKIGPHVDVKECQARGITVCVATMWATLEALELTVKKRRATPPSRSGPTSPRPAPPGARCKAA